MIKNLIIVIMLTVIASHAADAITGSVYINFEDGNDGDNVTGAILTNCAVSHGISVTYNTGTDDGVGATGAQSVTKIATAASYDVNWNFSVGGTNYSGNTGSRGIRTTGGGANGYIRVDFGATQHPVSIGFHWRANQTGDDYSQWDIVGFYPNFQLLSQKSGLAEIDVMAHWYVSGQSAASVALTSEHWYWVSMKRETNGNTFTINLYDTTDMSLVTSRTGTVTDGSGADTIAMGGIKYTGDWPTSTLDYDNLIINTNGTFPLLPVSAGAYVSPSPRTRIGF